jgi:hypothetical protein
MQTELIQDLWMYALAAAGPIAGVIFFANQLRTLRKTRLECEKLIVDIKVSEKTVQKLDMEMNQLAKNVFTTTDATVAHQSRLEYERLDALRKRETIKIALPDEIARYAPRCPAPTPASEHASEGDRSRPRRDFQNTNFDISTADDHPTTPLEERKPPPQLEVASGALDALRSSEKHNALMFAVMLLAGIGLALIAHRTL